MTARRPSAPRGASAAPAAGGGSSIPAAAVDASFAALADRKRREVIAALLTHPMRAGELAREVDLSPPSLSRHLRILRRAGLVTEDGDDADARVRIYRVREDGFAPVRDWIADVEAFWSAQLAAFKSYAEGKVLAGGGAPRAVRVSARRASPAIKGVAGGGAHGDGTSRAEVGASAPRRKPRADRGR